MNIGLAAFTDRGRLLMERLMRVMPGNHFDLLDSFGPVDTFDTAVFGAAADSDSPVHAPGMPAKGQSRVRLWTQQVFATCDAIIVIGAAGIAVRLMAPLIRSKDEDPAVVVIDEAGRFVIPLLSGHMGGANALASAIAARIGAEAVITTATDINGVFAVDVWSTGCGCVIDDITRIKEVSARLLAGGQVGFSSDFPVAGELPPGLTGQADMTVGIRVSLDARPLPFPLTLNIVPKIVIVGAGCKKNTSPRAFESFVLEELERHSVSIKSLRALASIDLKKNEACFQAFAEKYGLKFAVFSKEELEAVQGTFSSSSFVQRVTGVDNVCERSAMMAGGQRLLLSKTCKDGMTVALAVPEWVCRFYPEETV